ncbi:hypothetical protein RMHFA_05583 (plasmid) [Roseomonas mucosa]|uniref:hypothetical protein n=1 Tax=Roseomonas mucosa TaxID=207340 RepID=UPI0022451A03|nr:hypothetical protein [Roseomonas mucosa]UZO95004.1 hypothetical protein RMHFA_05583 [Roseomonas mucosa]
MTFTFPTTPEPIPVLFYFDKAESLRSYEGFTVDEMPVTRADGRPSAPATVWTVSAKYRFTSQRGPLAQFDSELYARVFRDMAEIVAAHV